MAAAVAIRPSGKRSEASKGRRRGGVWAAILVAAWCRVAAAAETEAAARGEYLAAIAGCAVCHTDAANGGRPFAGGRGLETRFGRIVTPNITPDQATGIGRWSLTDFIRALRWGVAPDDTHYLDIFPFRFYAGLSDGDLADLKAYLDSLPAVPRENGRSGERLFSAARPLLSLALLVTGFAGLPWRPAPDRDTVWNRGAYLVATLGRCGDCHTPQDWLGQPDTSRAFSGTPSGHDGKKVPNITQDPQSGIGSWSETEIEALLKTGQTPDFDFVGGAMADVVKGTARLSESDRHAIAVYLKSLPALPFPKG
jgi:mono/diheme cytochrome c family protein